MKTGSSWLQVGFLVPDRKRRKFIRNKFTSNQPDMGLSAPNFEIVANSLLSRNPCCSQWHRDYLLCLLAGHNILPKQDTSTTTMQAPKNQHTNDQQTLPSKLRQLLLLPLNNHQ